MIDLSGKFIVFDGGEGCGKSTQMRLLAAALESAGQKVLAVRDPGTTRIGEMIRAILLNPDHTEMNMRCEMLLYMAARAQMVAEVIRPALERGEAVLCDRFVSSTLAYQLGGDGLTFDEIADVALVAVKDRRPDLTLILDMPAEASRDRVKAKFQHKTLFGTETIAVKDRIELRPLEYHQQVRKNYLMQAERYVGRYRVVDAAKSAEEVHESVFTALINSLAP